MISPNPVGNYELGKSSLKQIISHMALLSLLAWLTPAIAATGDTLETRAHDLGVHSSPAAEAPVIMVLEYGRKLKELRRSGEWIKVIIYGTTGRAGWVREASVGPLQSERTKTVPDQKRAGNEPPTLSESGGTGFTLVITGSSQAFKAVCIVVDGQGRKKRISVEGHGPGSYDLDGNAVDCRVDRIDQHAGTLTVELYSRTSSLPLGANSTSEAFGCVHVRSNGPWGRADGRRCSRVIRYRNRR